MSDHAMLAPSSAERWLNCTPSARLEEHLPDSRSDYAAEGTLAHNIADLKLRKHFVKPGMAAKTFNNRMKPFKEDPLYQDEMQGHTDAYLEYVKSVAMLYKKSPQVMVEKSFDLSAYIPESFGKCDCVVISQHDIHIIDFKYGQGVPVSAENNPQMLSYALGAYLYYSAFYDFKNIHLTIFQPRIDNVSEWSTTAEGLIGWAESIRPTAQRAFDGAGEFKDGDWCRFCRAKATCRKQAESQLALAGFEYKKPPLLTDAEVGDAIAKGQRLCDWLEGIKEYALSAILAGKDIPGWKVVEGRSNRQFTDVDSAFAAAVTAGYSNHLLYERKPITLTAVEKLLGKTEFDKLLSVYVEKPKGKPTLANINDRREPYSSAVTAESVFEKVI